MDFGLARKLDAQATQSAVLTEEDQGTIAYLAPELMMGARLSQQSDVYALGVVMYELLTGERPFAHLSGLALAAAHIQSSSKLWPFEPETRLALAELARAMTAREPAHRLPSMQAVREAVWAITGGPAMRQAPATPWHWRARLRAFLRRATVLWLAGALVAAFGVGVFTMSTDVGRKYSPFFSESAAMRAGMAALRTFDREESVQVAIDSFTSVLEHRPDHAAAAAGLAMAYALRHAGDSRDETWLRRADASAQLALGLNDQLAMGYAAQAVVRNWQGKRDEALRLDEQALRLDPLNLFALNSRSAILLGMGRFDEAERAVQAAAKVYPHERTLADTLGMLRYQQGDYKAAEQAFRRSIEIEPDAVIAYANLSSALIHQDRLDEALQVLQRGLQIRPSGGLYTNLGNALFNRGDYVGAAQAFEHAVSASKGGGNDYLRWANLADTLRWIPGRAEASRQSYQEAVALLRPQLERSPSDPTLLSRMGLYSARLGDKQAAADLSRRAVQAAPDSADVRFRAAIAFELTGDRESALAELRIAQARGYPLNLISSEPDLIALRRAPRYHQPFPESAK
jgi:serine/threonine-protein kinase